MTTTSTDPSPSQIADRLEAYYRQPALWALERYESDPRQRLRARLLASLVDDDAESILDVGCGNGFITRHLRASRVVGLDPSPEALAHYEGQKVLGSADALPFEDRSFDTVVCAEVLEHLPEPVYRKAVGELARVARRQILIGVPYDQDLRLNMTRCAGCGRVYHVDLHCRSFLRPEGFEAVLPGFGVQTVSHVGHISRVRSRWFRTLDYACCGPRGQSDVARCPACGSAAHLDRPPRLRQRLAANLLDRLAWRMPLERVHRWMIVGLLRDQA